MKIETLRLIAAVHGALAWLCVLVLAAAAVFLVRRRAPARRRAALAVAALATALVTATFALGMLLHEPYQQRLRQRVFLKASALGWLFERKQHLAFGALGLALAALAALAALTIRERRLRSRAPISPSDPASGHLRAAALRGYAAAALLACAACVASVIVGRAIGF